MPHAAASPLVAAALLLPSLPPASAISADCGAVDYTGFSLITGTGCRGYVFCQNGEAQERLACPDGFLFDGGVGKHGACVWPDKVDLSRCDDPSAWRGGGGGNGRGDADLDANGGGSGGGGATSGNGGAANGGGKNAQGLEDVFAAYQSTPGASPSTPGDAPAPTPGNPGNLDANGSGHGGGDGEIGGDRNGIDAAGDNPHNFFCGRSVEDAGERCVPCPSGRMVECGADFLNGCFKGVTQCAGGVGSGNGSSGATSGNGVPAPTPGNQGEDPGGNKPSAPAPAPRTMPPWTNAPFVPSPRAGSKTVIGYYASWQWYDRDKYADPVNVDFSKYDRINFAFFQPDKDGNLYGTDEWADPQLLWGPYTWSEAVGDRYCSWDLPLEQGRNCNYHKTEDGILARAHAAGAEVMPSIGGWTLSDNFPGIAASASRRRNFARQCVELIEAYGFDGIDLDWEYPGYEDHSGTPADTVNFTLLLRAMRDELDKLGTNRFGRPYGLTAALPCGPDKIEKIQVDQIKDILTELNLMSYDLHGAWDPLTGANAPMFDQGWTDETPRWSVHGCVNNYVDLGVPLSKMNMGLPFYGRSFRGATGMKQFHGGADDINYHLDEGSPQYFNIVKELKGMKTYRHEKTQTQYAVFDNGGGVVSYDDPRAICDKVHYANERGMNGFLIWEISGDMIEHNGRMITPLIDAANDKIRNPGLDCSNLRDPSWALSEQTYRHAPAEPATVDWSQYDGPSGNSGSANDFNGAQESAWVPDPIPPPFGVPPDTDSSEDSGDDDDGDDCPPGATGYRPASGCASYMYCANGSVEGKVMPCVPGTLFDASIGVCTWESQVQCGS